MNCKYAILSRGIHKMNKLIIYGSEYGTTKCYADKLSEITGIKSLNYSEVQDLSDYDTVIYFGALYAGGVKGLKSTVKLLPQNAKIIIATVGLADVNDIKNIKNILSAIERQIPKNILDRATIFHLRGGIDYSKLSFKHKTMMTLLYNKAKRIPEEKKTADARAMIETFNKKVDFIDFDSLKPIIEAIK